MQVVKPHSEHQSNPPSSQPPKLSIVRIIDRLNIGGPSKHVVWLTAGLAPDEFETVLVTGTVPEGEGDMSYFDRSEGVEPLVLPAMSRELSLRDGLVAFQLLRLLWRLQPDVVHTHKAEAVGRVAAWLCKWLTPSALWLRPRPRPFTIVVHTFHGHVLHSYFGPFKTRVFVMIERLLAKLTDCIVTVSERQRVELSATFRVGKPEQYQVIRLGLDVDTAPSTPVGLRETLGLAPETVLIGIVGRLCEVRNHAMVLEAMAQLVEKAAPGGAVHLLVIGDGHLAEELSDYGQHLKIADHVTFTGFRKDVLALYPELDIVALTSLNEGTPLTLIEAMCHGRAVAATEVGGVVDILGELQVAINGFSVRTHGVTAPSGDVSAFARSLQHLIEHPKDRREMGDSGKAFVHNDFSKTRLFRDIERLYRDWSSLT